MIVSAFRRRFRSRAFSFSSCLTLGSTGLALRPRPQFGGTVGAGEKRDLEYEVVFRQGYNEKQSNVTLDRRG